MTNRRRRNVYVGVMLIALAAFAVDRLLTDSPRLVAAEGPSPPVDVRSEMPLEAGSLPVSIPRIPFPRGVQRAKMSVEFVDVFAPPWVRDGSPQRGLGPRPEAALTRVSLPRAFRERHTLTAIVAHGDVHVAVIDGLWVRVGDRLSGCELVRIADRTAVFKCDDEVVDITLSDPALNAPTKVSSPANR